MKSWPAAWTSEQGAQPNRIHAPHKTEIFGSSANVQISGGSNNTIGGPALADRNVIGGTFSAGISIGQLIQPTKDAKQNVIQGHLIGTDATGTKPVSNTTGVSIGTGCTSTEIVDNVISGNGTR